MGKYDDFGFIGFDLWQVKGGTLFDNIIITDDVKEADAFVQKWKAVSEVEKAKKKEDDDIRRRRRRRTTTMTMMTTTMTRRSPRRCDRPLSLSLSQRSLVLLKRPGRCGQKPVRRQSRLSE